MSDEINLHETACNFLASDAFAVFLGIEVVEVRKEYAKVAMRVRQEYLNSVDRAHGAAIFAIVDQAFAVACNACGPRGIAISVNINYHSAAAPGSIMTAEATAVSVRRKISTWRVVVNDEDGAVVATAEAVAYHK